jgi:putative ABC transport system permease protein
LRPGDDASCQNLYQASQPRVLGVTPQMIRHFDAPQAVSFPWSASAAEDSSTRQNPWRLLAQPAVEPGEPVPTVLDKNTALYSLHLYRGIGEEFTFDYDGVPIRFRVAGLLENSILQGSLLIGEADFRRRFPEISGYRSFLIDAPPEKAETVAAILENRFGDQGLDLTPTIQVLEQLLAVQNTYLSTFQSLGALGLLLGALGLATVQLRNVLERRGELALLRAVGYRRRRLALLVLLENVLLLTAGLATGGTAALLAVLPHKWLGEAAVSWLLLRDLAVMLAVVFLAGLISSLLTIRAVLRMPVLDSLRGE